MLVDSHCHLDFPELLAEEADVIARAREAIASGAARAKLDEFVNFTRRFAA